MSSTIEYRHLAVTADARAAEALIRGESKNENFYINADQVYLVFVEAGSNNGYEGPSRMYPRGRRARSWGIAAAGSKHEVISLACKQTYYVNDGSLWLDSNKRATPEGYLRKYRKVLAEAISSGDTLRMLTGCAVSWQSTLDDFKQHPWFAIALAEHRLSDGPPHYGNENSAARHWTLRLSSEGAIERVTADVAAIAWLTNVKREAGRIWVAPDWAMNDVIERYIAQRLTRACAGT